MVNILLTNIGRRSYFLNFFDELRKKGYRLKIFVSDTSFNTASFYVTKNIYKIITPRVDLDKNNYVKNLIKNCKKNKINLLIPLIDTELEIISKNEEKFKKIGTQVLISSNKLIKNLINKKKSYFFLKKNGFLMPKSFFRLKRFNNKFPIVIKKITGSAGEN